MIKFTIISIIFILFIIPTLLASQIKMIPAHDQPGYGDMGRVPIYSIHEFKQYFISKDRNLVAIGTTIKNPNLKNEKEIKFNLFDGNNNLMRSVTQNGFNIGDGDFVKFIFEVIPDSVGKEYYFTLSSSSAEEEEILELFLTRPTDWILRYSYNEEIKEGGTPMVTFHKPNSRLETVKLVYSNLFSKLLHLNSDNK